jgi:hypothetical protein
MLIRTTPLKLAVILILLLLVACEDSSINIPNKTGFGVPDTLLDIHSPVNNSSLPANTPYILDYVIINSEQGDYLEIQVDHQSPVTVVGQKGKHYMPGLTTGKHLVKVTAFRDKTPTGGKSVITINVQ